MSKTYKDLNGGARRHYIDDGVSKVDERFLYSRADRRRSASKSEKGPFVVWSDMKPKRFVRRNDNWQRHLPSPAELNSLDYE